MQREKRPVFIALFALALLGPLLYLLGMATRGVTMLQTQYIRLGLVYLVMAFSAAAAAYLTLHRGPFVVRVVMGVALLANLLSIAIMGSIWAGDMKRAVIEAEMPPIEAAKVGIVVAPLDHSQEASKEAYGIENLLANLVKQAEMEELIQVRHGYPVTSPEQAKVLAERMRANIVVWRERTGHALISDRLHVTVLGANETQMVLDPFNLMLLMSTQDTFTIEARYNVGESTPYVEMIVAPVTTGFAFLAVGKPLLAAGQFDAVIKGGQADGEALAKLYNYYATTLLFVPREDLAVPAYESSNKILPNADAWIGLGNAAVLRRDWVIAERAYAQALALAPYDPEPYCGLGILFARDHAVARAISTYRQAVALAPLESVPYAMLGMAYELDANLDGAREAYANAAQRSGPNAGLHLAVVERAEKIVRNPPTPVPTATARPIPTETPIPAKAQYVVKQGDTLSAIAMEFGVTPEDIVEANRLTSTDFIVVGMTLIIPEGDD